MRRSRWAVQMKKSTTSSSVCRLRTFIDEEDSGYMLQMNSRGRKKENLDLIDLTGSLREWGQNNLPWNHVISDSLTPRIFLIVKNPPNMLHLNQWSSIRKRPCSLIWVISESRIPKTTTEPSISLYRFWSYFYSPYSKLIDFDKNQSVLTLNIYRLNGWHQKFNSPKVNIMNAHPKFR